MSEINISNPILVYGEKGLSITNVYRVADDLYIELSDESELSVAGVKGDKGDTGVGIQSAALNQSGQLVITLTDNSTITSTEVVRGPKGDDGSSGADIVDGDVTDNQISLLKSDGSTVQLTGQINAASEAVGDMKATARNDVSAINYLPINTTTDTIHDKAVEPDLWEVMKEWKENKHYVAEDNQGEFWNVNSVNSIKTTSNGILVNCYLYNNKWIRTLYDISGKRLIFQVSDDFYFSSFREYIINSSTIYPAYSVTFLPEINKILYRDGVILKVLNVTDADDLNNYNEITYGGLGQSEIIHSPSFSAVVLYQIAISGNPTNQDNYTYVLSSETTRTFYANKISTLDTDFYSTAISINGDDLAADGYTCYFQPDYRLPKMSGSKLYFMDINLNKIISKDLETNIYTEEFDLAPYVPYTPYNVFNSIDGSVVFATDKTGPIFFNYFNNETTFKMCNKTNPNISDYQIEPIHYNPKASTMIVKLYDKSGLIMSDPDKFNYWISYDDGQNWSVLFTEEDQSGLAWNFGPQDTNLKLDSTNRAFWHSINNEFVTIFRDFEPFLNRTNRDNAMNYIKFQEEGYSDLLTVQSLYLNDDVKGFLRRKP